MAMPARTDTPPEASALVASLGLEAAISLPSHVTMLQVAKMMLEDGGGVAVVLEGTSSSVKGVVTSVDVARSVARKGWMGTFLQVAKGITAHPDTARMEERAMFCATKMIKKNLGHLPVVDMKPGVLGMLSITGCLIATIPLLGKEGHQKLKVNGIDLNELTMGGIMSKDVTSFVNEGDMITAAAALIAKDKKAVIVRREGQCVGLITPGIIVRVVAESLDLGATAVSDVMQRSFDATPPEQALSVVLAQMRDKNIEHVVVGGEGRVFEVVSSMDILEILAGTNGSDRREAFVESMADSAKDHEAPSVQPGNKGSQEPRAPAVSVYRSVAASVNSWQERTRPPCRREPSSQSDAGAESDVAETEGASRAPPEELSGERKEPALRDMLTEQSSVFVEEQDSVAIAEKAIATSGKADDVSGSTSVDRSSEERGTPESGVTDSSGGPEEALVISDNRTVSEVAREMALKKADAALLTRRNRVVGVVTNGDLTRRVIAADKSPHQTAVREVMTPIPAMMMARVMSNGVDGARQGTVEEEGSSGSAAPSGLQPEDRKTLAQATKTGGLIQRPILMGVGLAALAVVSIFSVMRSRR